MLTLVHVQLITALDFDRQLLVALVEVGLLEVCAKPIELRGAGTDWLTAMTQVVVHRLLLLVVTKRNRSIAVCHHSGLKLWNITLVNVVTSIIVMMSLMHHRSRLMVVLVARLHQRAAAHDRDSAGLRAFEWIRTRRLHSNRSQLILFLLVFQLVLLVIEALQDDR